MRFAPAIAALVTIAPIAAPAAAPAPVTGNWLTVDGKALVQIAQCGPALCGRIVRIIKPTPGRPQTDIKNPDAAKRGRPLAGLTILSGLTADGGGWRGQIYDPESGRTYRSELTRQGNALSVKGCWGPFCKTQRWTATS